MEYNYLQCDGPNCEQRRDLRNSDSDGPQDDSPENQADQGDAGTYSGEQLGPDEQAGSTGPPDQSSAGPWFALDTGAQVFHFCTYDCLAGFVNSSDGADNSLKRYAEFFGYEYSS